MTYIHVTRTPDMSLEETTASAPRWGPSRSTATSSTTSASRTAPSALSTSGRRRTTRPVRRDTALPGLRRRRGRPADGQTIFGFDSTGRN